MSLEPSPFPETFASTCCSLSCLISSFPEVPEVSSASQPLLVKSSMHKTICLVLLKSQTKHPPSSLSRIVFEIGTFPVSFCKPSIQIHLVVLWSALGMKRENTAIIDVK